MSGTVMLADKSLFNARPSSHVCDPLKPMLLVCASNRGDPLTQNARVSALTAALAEAAIAEVCALTDRENAHVSDAPLAVMPVIFGSSATVLDLPRIPLPASLCIYVDSAGARKSEVDALRELAGTPGQALYLVLEESSKLDDAQLSEWMPLLRDAFLICVSEAVALRVQEEIVSGGASPIVYVRTTDGVGTGDCDLIVDRVVDLMTRERIRLLQERAGAFERDVATLRSELARERHASLRRARELDQVREHATALERDLDSMRTELTSTQSELSLQQAELARIKKRRNLMFWRR